MAKQGEIYDSDFDRLNLFMSDYRVEHLITSRRRALFLTNDKFLQTRLEASERKEDEVNAKKAQQAALKASRDAKKAAAAAAKAEDVDIQAYVNRGIINLSALNRRAELM